MHHRHTGPSLPARLTAAGSRTRRRTVAVVRARRGRLGLGLIVVALVTGFVLTAPVVTGPAAPVGITLDSSSAARLGDSPVVMGIDGLPTSSTSDRASARLMSDPAVPTPSTAVAAPPAQVPPSIQAPPPAAVPEETSPGTAGTPARTTSAPVTDPAPSTTLPAAPAPPRPAAAPAALDRAGEVLVLVNQQRATAGCRPLSSDDVLAGVAATHSTDMRDRSFFDHVNLAGLSPFDRADAAGASARAENIARGQADAAAVMHSWMASPGHRANILDCSLTRLGVGIADGGGGPWWTQLFS